jgi:hypothetical protein
VRQETSSASRGQPQPRFSERRGFSSGPPGAVKHEAGDRSTTLNGSTHPICVGWRRTIKLTRATTLQLLRGGMTRAGLPRPSQTKRRQSIEEWTLPSGGSRYQPELNGATTFFNERASRGDERAAGGYGEDPERARRQKNSGKAICRRGSRRAFVQKLSSGFFQRYTTTGTVACASTFAVTLPSSMLTIPLRPWDAITMTSQALSFAAATIASWGWL